MEDFLTFEQKLLTPFLSFSGILAVLLYLDIVFGSLQAFFLYLSMSLANSYFFLPEPAAKEKFLQFTIHGMLNMFLLKITTIFKDL
jgi:hypothetical protein